MCTRCAVIKRAIRLLKHRTKAQLTADSISANVTISSQMVRYGQSAPTVSGFTSVSHRQTDEATRLCSIASLVLAGHLHVSDQGFRSFVGRSRRKLEKEEDDDEYSIY